VGERCESATRVVRRARETDATAIKDSEAVGAVGAGVAGCARVRRVEGAHPRPCAPASPSARGRPLPNPAQRRQGGVHTSARTVDGNAIDSRLQKSNDSVDILSFID
jgi:hypothetical protein